ncbi:MAG: adenylate/guanylate cyclase domain-containing protein, partial [bacterium]
AHALLNIVGERLDNVIWKYHRSNIKQDLIESVTERLCDPMFGRAMDKAVSELSGSIDFRELLIFYRLSTSPESQTVHYRYYKGNECVANSIDRTDSELESLVDRHGMALLDDRGIALEFLQHSGESLRETFQFGMDDQNNLGSVYVTFDNAPGNLERDLFRIFARSINQRLIDFYREWRTLAKFFAPEIIHRLMSDPEYDEKYLAPREETAAILYADLTSFTRLCEENVGQPERISEFVDEWGHKVVQEIWNRGGTFDKMVGDCVIALFGPPFYDRESGELVDSALQTAHNIQQMTTSMIDHPVVRDIEDSDFPGLGVAIGVNLCEVTCGLYGPDDDFTAFGTGMNETARLQSLAGFRETYVMKPVVDEFEDAPDDLTLKGPRQTQVKNVEAPLHYYQCEFDQ